MAPITIRGNTLDPARPGNVVVPTSTKYVIIQLKHELDLPAVKILQANSLNLIKLFGDNNWLCASPNPNLKTIQALSPVQYALAYLPLFKIPASVRSLPTLAGNATDVRDISIALHQDAQVTNDLLTQLKKLTGLTVTSSSSSIVIVRANRALIDKIAAFDQVEAVNLAVQASTKNNRTAGAIYLTQYNENVVKVGGVKFTGQNQLVAVADSGVDDEGVMLKGKVKNAVWYDPVPKPDLTSLRLSKDYVGHGTHVAGTVAGNPMKAWNGEEVSGIAPNAQIYAQVIPLGKSEGFGAQPGLSYDLSTKLDDIVKDAYNAGALIQNHSWGANLDINHPQQLPYTVHDAAVIDRLACAYPNMLFVWSAGNDRGAGGLTHEIGSWAAAKNVLTVGATFGTTPTQNQGIGEVFDPVGHDPNPNCGKTAPFSSRGPVLNTGRTKPDVVCPGVCILSARSNQLNNIGAMEKWNRDYGEPLSGVDKDKNLIYCSGTSMAAPAVSGIAALVREAFARFYSVEAPNPNAPVFKAIIINGTKSLAGETPETQGFGQVHMPNIMGHMLSKYSLIGTDAPNGFAFDTLTQFSSLTTVKTTYAKCPLITDPRVKSIDFSVTLVWHDPPGEDLQMKMGLKATNLGTGAQYLGYKANQPIIDNVQRIYISGMKAGEQVKMEVEMHMGFAVVDTHWGLAWTHVFNY